MECWVYDNPEIFRQRRRNIAERPLRLEPARPSRRINSNYARLVKHLDEVAWVITCSLKPRLSCRTLRSLSLNGGRGFIEGLDGRGFKKSQGDFTEPWITMLVLSFDLGEHELSVRLPGLVDIVFVHRRSARSLGSFNGFLAELNDVSRSMERPRNDEVVGPFAARELRED